MRWSWFVAMLLGSCMATASPALSRPPARLERLWTLEGPYWGVVVAGDHIYASSGEHPLFRLQRITLTGAIEAGMPQLQPTRLRPLRPARPEQLLLGFWTWSQWVLGIDGEGRTKRLVSTPNEAVDDVASFDADGDGDDELILGFNASGGVWLAERSGEVLWKNTDVGNAWSVAGAVLGGRRRIVSTEAGGRLFVFDSTGSQVARHSLPFYANRVLAAGPDRLVVAGTGMVSPDSTMVAVCDGTGRTVWMRQVHTGRRSLTSVAVALGSGLIAAGSQQGDLWLLDLSDGGIVANRPRLPWIWDLAWFEENPAHSPVLLIASAKGLLAYRVIR